MAIASDATLQIKTIVPSFTVDDIQKSLKFYESLGFAVEERWEEKGVLLGVMLRSGDYRLGLGQDDWKKGRNRTKGVGMRVHIATAQDIDQLAARAKAAGISLDSEPHDTDYSGRTFEVTDPSGFKLAFASKA